MADNGFPHSSGAVKLFGKTPDTNFNLWNNIGYLVETRAYLAMELRYFFQAIYSAKYPN